MTGARTTCPAPLGADTIQLAHGGGGRKMQALLERVFFPAFDNAALAARHDAATLSLDGAPARLAFTTDAYVIRPLEFPGGDIGKLAVTGTINDLAMAGARARWLSAAFVLEEGLPIATLERVVRSMRAAADAAGVTIACGDTKVVERGKGDGIFIATSGVGVVAAGADIAPKRARPGDAVLVSGDVGRHGVAILSVREGLAFETAIESDCAPLDAPIARLLDAGVDLHVLRDATRGGLASVVNEIARDGGVGVALEEERIPVEAPVRGACELFGLDPLYVACEGRFVAFLPEDHVDRALAILRAHPISAGAARIGRVADGEPPPGVVTVRTRLGTVRTLDLLSGEQLPRIC